MQCAGGRAGPSPKLGPEACSGDRSRVHGIGNRIRLPRARCRGHRCRTRARAVGRCSRRSSCRIHGPASLRPRRRPALRSDRRNLDQSSRPTYRHFGFGGGVHSCFGAPLARIEAQIALGELTRRLADPRLLQDPPPYRVNPILRGPRYLPLGIEAIRP
jgi:Cytochrome P450